MPESRIAIVGVGQVGAAAAYALILASVATELLLVDDNVSLRDGQVCDLSDVAYSCNSRTKVRAADHHEAGRCDIIVITAGSRHTIGKRNGKPRGGPAQVLYYLGLHRFCRSNESRICLSKYLNCQDHYRCNDAFQIRSCLTCCFKPC